MAEHVVYRPNLCRWHAARTGYLLVLVVAFPCTLQDKQPHSILVMGDMPSALWYATHRGGKQKEMRVHEP